MTVDAPTRDGTTMPLHIDSKRRKKLKQKKTSLGHAEDDHEDWNIYTHAFDKNKKAESQITQSSLEI